MSIAQTVQDLFRQSKQEWLDGARATARKLLRNNYAITIEDVLEQYKFPKYLHRNTIGSVFKHSDFTTIGFVPSRRTVSHGRYIRQWTLANPIETEQDCE